MAARGVNYDVTPPGRVWLLEITRRGQKEYRTFLTERGLTMAIEALDDRWFRSQHGGSYRVLSTIPVEWEEEFTG